MAIWQSLKAQKYMTKPVVCRRDILLAHRDIPIYGAVYKYVDNVSHQKCNYYKQRERHTSKWISSFGEPCKVQK